MAQQFVSDDDESVNQHLRFIRQFPPPNNVFNLEEDGLEILEQVPINNDDLEVNQNVPHLPPPQLAEHPHEDDEGNEPEDEPS